jgi:hypothetical protein
MAVAQVTQGYSSDEDGDIVNFSIVFPPESAPRFDDVKFSVEYRPRATKPDDIRKQELLFVTADSLEGQPPQFYAAQGKQLFFTGQMDLVIKGKSASGEAIDEKHTFEAGNRLNTKSGVALSAFGPELGRALNSVDVSGVSAGVTTDDERVTEILAHVYQQLKGGLGPVWKTFPKVPTKDGVALRDVADLSSLTPAELEECWAQHISEWLVATPYGGPGTNYRSGGKDEQMYALMIREDDPAVPIIFACQQLCSAAAVSRGFDDCAAAPLDSHQPPGATAMTKWKIGVGTPGGRIEKSDAVCDAATGIAQGVLLPGATFVKASMPHAAFVLRVLQSGELQLIDTGAMQTDPKHTSPFAAGAGSALSSGMNYDTGLGVSVTKAKFTHLGSIGKATRLVEGITRMRRTRPLGLARLVILDRLGKSPSDNNLQKRLRWASGLLPMWEDEPTQQLNYSITRYFWSLRGHPHAERFEARWLIDIPQDLTTLKVPTTTFTRMKEGGRAFNFTSGERDAKTKPPATHSFNVMDLATTAEGKVSVVGRFSDSEQFVNLLTGSKGIRAGAFVSLPLGRVDAERSKLAPPTLTALVSALSSLNGVSHGYLFQ